MHIAYVTETYPPEINGVALTVARTVRFLRERHRVHLIRPRQPGEPARNHEDEWRTPGLPIPMYPDLRIGLATTGRLKRHLAAAQPDLVHVATQGPLGRAAVLAANALGIPATTDFRTNFHWYSRYYRLGWLEPVVRGYLRQFHNRAATTFVPTDAVRRALQAQGFERLDVVGRGVDTMQFGPQHRSPSLRAAWGVRDGAPVLLYVGRLAPEKNVALALRACETACRVCPEARTVVVGDGPLRGQLEAQFPRARFVGMQRGAQLAAHYASGDVFVFPSQSETFGNVTLEALASGLAVVAFDAAAAASHIAHGHSGVLVPPDAAPASAAAAFVAATVAALEHAHAGAPMRRAARQAALAAQWDAVLHGFEDTLLRRAAATTRSTKPDVAMA